MHHCHRLTAPIAVALMLSVLPTVAQAELFVYEPFDYSAGAAIDGLAATGTNLTGNYTKSSLQDLQISSPGLTYGNLLGDLPPVAGNRLNDLDGVGVGFVTVAVDQDVLIGSGEAIYFSALFTFDDSLNGNHFARITLRDDVSGDQILFGESVVGGRAIRVEAFTAATDGLVADGADGSFTDGQTLWLIGRYFNSALPDGDSLELIGYDTALAQSIAPTFDPTDPNAKFSFGLTDLDIDLSRISSVTFEIRGTNNNFIDELRIGSSYADVTSAEQVALVPEPGTGLVFLSGLVLLGCVYRRERHERNGRRQGS
jgi:hypothetical protein